MVLKRKIAIKENYQNGISLEQSGDLDGAIAAYQKVLRSDPAHEAANSRLMILYRKTRQLELEVKLIQKAVLAYRKQIEAGQREWIKKHQKQADLTKELAKSLGLLQDNGLPAYQSELLNRWEARLYLASHRLENQKKKAQKTVKKQASVKAKPKSKP